MASKNTNGKPPNATTSANVQVNGGGVKEGQQTKGNAAAAVSAVHVPPAVLQFVNSDATNMADEGPDVTILNGDAGSNIASPMPSSQNPGYNPKSGGRKPGQKNYANEILFGFVDRMQPKTLDDWNKLASAYSSAMNDGERLGGDVRRHFNRKRADWNLWLAIKNNVQASSSSSSSSTAALSHNLAYGSNVGATAAASQLGVSNHTSNLLRNLHGLPPQSSAAPGAAAAGAARVQINANNNNKRPRSEEEEDHEEGEHSGDSEEGSEGEGDSSSVEEDENGEVSLSLTDSQKKVQQMQLALQRAQAKQQQQKQLKQLKKKQKAIEASAASMAGGKGPVVLPGSSRLSVQQFPIVAVDPSLPANRFNSRPEATYNLLQNQALQQKAGYNTSKLVAAAIATGTASSSYSSSSQPAAPLTSYVPPLYPMFTLDTVQSLHYRILTLNTLIKEEWVPPMEKNSMKLEVLRLARLIYNAQQGFRAEHSGALFPTEMRYLVEERGFKLTHELLQFARQVDAKKVVQYILKRGCTFIDGYPWNQKLVDGVLCLVKTEETEEAGDGSGSRETVVRREEEMPAWELAMVRELAEQRKQNAKLLLALKRPKPTIPINFL